MRLRNVAEVNFSIAGILIKFVMSGYTREDRKEVNVEALEPNSHEREHIPINLVVNYINN